MDTILMGYCMVVQVRTMMGSVMYKSDFRIGKMILSRVLVMPCSMLLRAQLRNTSSIPLYRIVRGRVGDLGYAL